MMEAQMRDQVVMVVKCHEELGTFCSGDSLEYTTSRDPSSES